MDRKQLVEIFKLSTPKYFNPKVINDFGNYLEQQREPYFTIEHQNESDKLGRITWIFFHPNSPGHGLETKAVKHCLDILTLNPSVEKLVITTSQLAYKFFDKFGFDLVKTKKDHGGKDLDLYIMKRYSKNQIT